MSRFRRIALISKPEHPRLGEILGMLDGFLAEQGIEVLLDPNAAAVLGAAASTEDLVELCRSADLALVVGGDGTLLRVARNLVDLELPLAGINLGRLGFLVDISPDGMLQCLSNLLAGNYLEERRMLLAARIDDGEPILALNDVVLHKWNIARMIEFETWVDDRLLDSQRSDGIIVSTPTGSTAYALSGGGPLIEPGLDAVALVPICPHTLSNRPLVVSGHRTIRLRVSGRTDPSQVRVTCDGQVSLELSDGQEILIRRHQRDLRLLHPTGHDHFQLLRAKLGWGGRHAS